MKKLIKLIPVILLGIVLASCGETSNNKNTPVDPPNPGPSIQEPDPEPELVEVSTTEVEGGKYMYNDVVYDIDKTLKKVTVTRYTSYTAYKNNTGTLLFEKSIKYVKYEKSDVEHNAVYFENDSKVYYMYVKGTSTMIEEKSGLSFSSGGVVRMTDILEPTYGLYVSSLQEQERVDENGQRIPNGDGGYEKENFYLCVELTQTSAKLYKGTTSTTHDSTPLHQISNYEMLLIAGKIVIRIPHQNGNYNCSITIKANNKIHVNNSYETHGDYSASGDFTLINE